MEVILFLMIPTLLAFFLSDLDSASLSDKGRDKMKDDILKIEKSLNLTNTHHEIELDRMSDRNLTNLYRDLGDKFDCYIEERNAKDNKKALEDF